MINQIVLVGRLVNLDERGNKTIITLACIRNFKNQDGEYETDLIDFILWGGVAGTTKEYCKKGDIIGIKGRIQTRVENDIRYTDLIAERITFLSTKKEAINE